MATIPTVEVGLTDEARSAVAELKAMRRERIATAMAAAFVAGNSVFKGPNGETYDRNASTIAQLALQVADVLIAELDK